MKGVAFQIDKKYPNQADWSGFIDYLDIHAKMMVWESFDKIPPYLSIKLIPEIDEAFFDENKILNRNTGILYFNSHKNSEKSPDYIGEINLCNYILKVIAYQNISKNNKLRINFIIPNQIHTQSIIENNHNNPIEELGSLLKEWGYS